MSEKIGYEEEIAGAGTGTKDKTKDKQPSLKINALSNTTSLLFNVLIGFYTTRLTIGYFDEVRFGMWMLTSSVVGYFGLLQMGVGTGVLRYAPLYRGRKELEQVSGVISTAMAFYGALGIMIFVLCTFFGSTLAAFFNGGPELAALIRVVGLAAAIECPTWVVDATIRSFEKFIIANALVNTKAFLRAAATVFCIYMQYSVVELGWSLVVVNSIMLAASMTAQSIVCREVKIGARNMSMPVLKMLMSYGIVILITSTADTLTFGSAKIILGRTVSLEAVGIFAVAALLINYYRRAIYAVTKVFMPRFSFLQGADDCDQIRTLYLRGSKFSTICAGAIAVLLWTIGPAFIRLWLAKDYSVATPILMVMTAGTLVLASNRMAIDLMYGLGKQGALAVMGVIEGLSVLALSVLLAYRYGVIGVAYGVAIPIVIMRGLVQAIYVCRLVKMKFSAYYGEHIILLWFTAAAMGVLFWLLHIDMYAHGWTKFIAMTAGVLGIYFGITYVFALNNSDRAQIKSLASTAASTLFSGLQSARSRISGKIALNALKAVKRRVEGVVAIIRNLHKIWPLVRESLDKTYYPEMVRKSELQMFFENLWWLLKHKELNEFYFVYGFDRKHGSDQTQYMDYVSFRRLRTKANASARCAFRSVDYRCLLSDKFAFAQYLYSLGFPTPKVLALCERSSVLWFGSNKLEKLESLLENGKLDCFMKDLTGECAHGVHTLKVDGKIILLDSKPITLMQLAYKLTGSWILQERIQQHPQMALLYPNSVNTIRLVTTYNPESPKAFSALIRIGANGNHCDNWAIGGLLGSVDFKTGLISKYCLFKPGYGTRMQVHPETGVRFENFKVPYFKEAVEMAVSLHRYFYGVHSIGWDIGITPKGPIFIEGNDNWELSMHQALEGGLKQKFLDALKS